VTTKINLFPEKSGWKDSDTVSFFKLPKIKVVISFMLFMLVWFFIYHVFKNIEFIVIDPTAKEVVETNIEWSYCFT